MIVNGCFYKQWLFNLSQAISKLLIALLMYNIN